MANLRKSFPGAASSTSRTPSRPSASSHDGRRADPRRHRRAEPGHGPRRQPPSRARAAGARPGSLPPRRWRRPPSTRRGSSASRTADASRPACAPTSCWSRGTRPPTSPPPATSSGSGRRATRSHAPQGRKDGEAPRRRRRPPPVPGVRRDQRLRGRHPRGHLRLPLDGFDRPARRRQVDRQKEVVAGGADGSGKSLAISGEVRQGFAYPWAGVMFLPGAQPMAPADLSRFARRLLRRQGRGRGHLPVHGLRHPPRAAAGAEDLHRRPRVEARHPLLRRPRPRRHRHHGLLRRRRPRPGTVPPPDRRRAAGAESTAK